MNLTEKIECAEKWKNGFLGTYRNHRIQIERDHPSRDWCIIVTDPQGRAAYDGYWKDSAGKSVGEAIKQALKGSKL